MGGIEHGGFYEEDEPVEDVLRAFEVGVAGVTASPHRGRTMYLNPGSAVVTEAVSRPSGELVAH